MSRLITVNASKSYDIIIDRNIFSKIVPIIKSAGSAKAAIISDTNVWPLYGDNVSSYLINAGIHTVNYVFPAGEEQKNGGTYLEILNFLSCNKLDRLDILIALGGGVVGDITGFAAATYLRGIRYIQIPTTLLAMVDSSVGGKTAIDLPAGKNLAGAFHQPYAVLCDINTLDTLPEPIFRYGCAEVIKYGVLFDPTLFAHLQEHRLNFDREYVISQCVTWKRDIVHTDEFDTGERQKLNLGHTVGHAIELFSNYRISHGSAVAIGMAVISRAASYSNFCSSSVAEEIQSVLSAFQLPISTDYNTSQIFTATLSDKKCSGNSLSVIVPTQIGACIIEKMSFQIFKDFFEKGL